MLTKIGKLIAILLGIAMVCFLTLFIAMSIANSPAYAWRILPYGQSDIGDSGIFPYRTRPSGHTL